MSSDPFSGDEFKPVFQQLRRFLEQRGCRDPEESAQEVVFRGLRRLRDGVDTSEKGLRAYLFGIARKVALECLKPKHTREGQMEPEDWDAISSSVLTGPNANERREHRDELLRYLRALGSDDARFIVAYSTGDRTQLRAATGLSAANLRVRAHRIRKRLRALRDAAS
jgi:DNA-directed RNA polymerase specialized sigma24 family protein